MTREPEPTPERPGPESPRAAPDSALPEDALDRVLGAAFGSRPRAAPNEAASGALHAGARVRHLRVVRLLGRGGMGELHVAHDERLGRDVALKAIHKGARLSDEARARFKREARILAGLDHPGICRIHEYLETPEADYLVLELIDGEPLRARGPRQTGAAALELCIQIASALEAAHAAGIVHRDLKPSNVMVTREGQVKVLDFGVARALRDTERARPRDVDRAQIVGGELTHAGAVIGTLAYMSPEQARGEEAGAASDVFSFGLLVQELWTGEAARDEGLAPLELLARVESGERRPLRGVPAEIERLVAELCAVQPSARPTAAAARERLAWILAAPRRRARRVAIGGAAALLLAFGAKYTLDLRAAHAASTANLERADGLIDFMHEDLWEKLDGIGRLDVLEDICERSTAYFESLDAEDLSDDQLAGHARTLRHIGIVWRDKAEDSLDRADEAFRRSHGWSELLAERAPGDRERKFERGQAEFYVGDLAFVRRDWAEALVWFRRYHATSEELLAEAPEDPDLAMEVAWARQGIGAVLLKRAEPEEALAEFEAAAGTWRRLLSESPEDPALREEQASVESWIAEAAVANGDLEAAAEAAESSLGRWQALSSEDGERRDHAFTAVVAVQRVARIELERNEAQSALERLDESRGTLERLVEWDPENGEWARSLAIHWAHVARARLALGETEAAGTAVDRALTSLSELLEFDPGNADLLYERGAAWVVAGEQAAAVGEPERARECARLALADFGEKRERAEPGWRRRAVLLASED